MLTYATILIACLILAVVGLFLYNVISDSSRSVYSSKDRIAIIDRHPEENKVKAKHGAVTNALNSIDKRDGVPQWSMAESTPAMPAGNSGRGNQVPGQLAHHGAGVADVSHCSLYNVNAAEPESKNTRNAGWLSREDRREPGGKVYKVKRHSAPRSTDSQGINQPWGW
jgi:hypothetical protein